MPDIGVIIGQALIEAGRNSDKAAIAIASALHNLPQPATMQATMQATKPPTSWEFKIIRDSDGNMTSIKATSN